MAKYDANPYPDAGKQCPFCGKPIYMQQRTIKTEKGPAHSYCLHGTPTRKAKAKRK